MKMFYFRQNLKKKDLLTPGYEKSVYMLFKTFGRAYNELINKSKNDKPMERFNINSELVKSSKNFKILGPFLTKTLLGNYDINVNNYLKNMKKDASYNRPGFRTKETPFFIAFWGNSFNVCYQTNTVTLSLNKKSLTFNIPKNLSKRKNKIKMVRLHKDKENYYLVYEFVYCNIQNKIPQQNNNNKRVLKCGVDLGMDTLIAAYCEEGRPLIISGKYLKYVNNHYNFLFADLDAKKDKKKIEKLHYERSNKIKAIFNYACKRLFDYLNYNNVKVLYVGDFNGVKDKVVAKNFFQISYYLLVRKMKDYAVKYNINLQMTEESYSSKTSFYDREQPKFQNEYLGSRVKRGLFITKEGKRIHADINGAAQILSKRHMVHNRENILLKPYYIDLVKEEYKVKSKISDFFNREYKSESKIKEKIKEHSHNPLNFRFSKFVNFNAHCRKGDLEHFYYCSKNKIITSDRQECLKKLKLNR